MRKGEIKMKKKIFSALLAMLIVGVSTVPAFAAESTEEVDAQVAYMNLEEASPEMKEDILQARNDIIYNTSWVEDGWSGEIVNMATGEVVEEVPEFHEIFPEDWDLPVDESVEDMAPTISPMSTIFSGTIYLRRATNVPADPFFRFTLNTTYFYATTYASWTAMSDTVNIAYIDYNTGASYGYKVNLPVGYGFSVFPSSEALSSSVNIAVKASTYSDPGNAGMVVERFKAIEV